MQTYTAEQLLSPSHSDILEEIVLLIAHSFTEDPGTKWLFNNYTRSQYISVLPAYFRFTVMAALLSGAFATVIMGDHPTATSPSTAGTKKPQGELISLPSNSRIRALGIMIPSSGNTTFESIWTVIRAGLLTLPFRCGFVSIYKLFTQIGLPVRDMQDRIFQDPDERHGFWHLLFMAAHSDAQGQGLGTMILAEFQEVVGRSEEGKKRKDVLFIEANTNGSRRLYSRVGFVDRGSMAYGDCVGNDKDLIVDVDGKVTGGRIFGMVWTP